MKARMGRSKSRGAVPGKRSSSPLVSETKPSALWLQQSPLWLPLPSPEGGWPSDGWQGVGRLAPVILAVQPRDSLGSTLSRWCPPQGGAWRRQGLIFQF